MKKLIVYLATGLVGLCIIGFWFGVFATLLKVVGF